MSYKIRVQNRFGAELEIARAILEREGIPLLNREVASPVVEGTISSQTRTFKVTFPGAGTVEVVMGRNGDLWKGGLSVSLYFEGTIRFGEIAVGNEIEVVLEEEKVSL